MIINIARQPPRRDVQRHLGVVARPRRRGDRRHPDLRPRPARERRTTSSPRRRTTPGFSQQHVLVLRAAARLPADACTRSPASTPRRTSPRRRTTRRRPRRKGVWQSVFYSAIIGYIVLLAITFAAADPNAVNEGGGTVVRRLRERDDARAWVKSILIIAAGRPAVLRHELPDQRLAHDVRVQPRRRGPGLDGSGARSTHGTDPVQRRDLRARCSR